MNILEPFISDPIFNLHKDYMNMETDIEGLLKKVECRLAGNVSLSGVERFNSVEAQVVSTMMESMDLETLKSMWYGWQPWL